MTTPSSQERHPIHTFDIDSHLNHIIPRPRFYLLPKPISYWFGYRAPKSQSQNQNQSPPSQPTSVLLNWLFSFLGAFIGIAIIENVFRHLPTLGGHPAPLVIASFGAAAILEYNAIESPLSQPRNLIMGHFLSAVIGVGITKLFHLLPEARFEDLRWLAGALSVGIASTVMGVTKTVHPPAGATALLAATTPEMTVLGWWLLPLVLLACCLMLSSAMLVNNLYKRFPVYWWTPADLENLRQSEVVKAKDVEKDGGSSVGSVSDVGGGKVGRIEGGSGSDTVAASHDEGEGEEFDTAEKKRLRNIHDNPEMKVQIEIDRIVVPDWMGLSQWEVEVLEGFQMRLRNSEREA
ncbi:hypothetical protein PMZ80_000610 [Knufia obscura]|uniref:HPP transmembrane region domain-containing protein n=1 Tax=Knufia obscura TaxID=1635080 RepID=A0ABR0S0R8_9EURO|nr:hypothetical protein PMZ80_000610 [Knufia obscura]